MDRTTGRPSFTLRVRRRLAATLQGLARRAAPPPTPIARYYPQQPSCQLGHLWLLLSRYLGERTHGTFVEIGGYDGLTFSNTWGLAARGWHG